MLTDSVPPWKMLTLWLKVLAQNIRWWKNALYRFVPKACWSCTRFSSLSFFQRLPSHLIWWKLRFILFSFLHQMTCCCIESLVSHFLLYRQHCFFSFLCLFLSIALLLTWNPLCSTQLLLTGQLKASRTKCKHSWPWDQHQSFLLWRWSFLYQDSRNLQFICSGWLISDMLHISPLAQNPSTLSQKHE